MNEFTKGYLISGLVLLPAILVLAFANQGDYSKGFKDSIYYNDCLQASGLSVLDCVHQISNEDYREEVVNLILRETYVK